MIHHYSVAQHCVEVSRRMAVRRVRRDVVESERMLRLAGLLHDFSEGLGFGDIVGPVKRALGAAPKVIEREIERHVANYFGLPMYILEHDAVKRADRACLHLEQTCLRRHGRNAGTDDELARDLPDGDWATPIRPLDQGDAFRAFLGELTKLTGVVYDGGWHP